MLPRLSFFVSKGRTRFRSLSHFAAAMVRVTGEVLRAHVRVDLQLAAIVLVYLIAFVPIIPRATESPQALRCCIDDEAPLSMALDGMRVLPYGDPFNFVLAPTKGVPLPTYWDQFNYAGSGYHYGGLYFGLAFLAYGPMEILGFPPFPTVPIILRTLSILAGLLALLVTYNFALMQIGRVAAVVSTLILLTDTYFIHYAIIVHPDGLQFALALLALAVAARHVDDGELESLGALGFLSGLIQGTKMGGPWMIPLAAVALVEGVRRRHDLPRPAIIALILRRGLLLLLLSIIAYFVSTPYAFLSPDFFIETRRVLTVVTNSTLTPTNVLNWLSDLWTHFGSLFLLVALVGALSICFDAVKGRVRWPLVLAMVLGASQLLWYTLNGKLWVELGYMLGTFAVLGFLVGESVELAGRFLSYFGWFGIIAKRLIAGCSILAIVMGGWWNVANLALFYRLLDSTTAFQIGHWAEAGNIPRDAKIVVDNTAYFNPAIFPNARMRGDLLTYNQIYEREPDYIVLSSVMYDARHYAQLRRTQSFKMQDEGPASVRLYQDLLKTDDIGPTQVAGIELTRIFSQSRNAAGCADRTKDDSSYEPWIDGKAADTVAVLAAGWFGTNFIGAWINWRLSGQIQQINAAGKWWDALHDKICINIGPTLRLYRVRQPGTADGFSRPIASTSWPGLRALYAFDGNPSHWMPSSKDAVPWVGFDFGGGAAKNVNQVRIEWLNPQLISPTIQIEFRDGEGEWKTIADQEIDGGAKTSLATEVSLPPDLGAHRSWRVVFRGASPNYSVAVREVRFLNTAVGH